MPQSPAIRRFPDPLAAGHGLNVQPERARDETQPASRRAKIKVESVSKQFLQTKSKLFTREWTPGVAALKDISIDFPEFSFVSVLGPSGCGKTTLLRIVAGLLPASSGAVFIDDQPVTGPRPDSGMVFQYIGLFPWRTVEENVFFSREMQLHRPLTASEKEAARRFVPLVGLSGFEQSFPHQLSGGMQQRVGIARALAVEPDVLLMDEPFGALDAITRDILHDELERVVASKALTVVFVTHNVREAARLGDRILLLSSRPGRVVAEFPVDVPRPRRIEAPDVAAITAQVMVDLRSEVRRHG